VTVNHEFLMSSHYTQSERALATLSLDWHGGTGLDVLVGGLGLGYTANAALECRGVERVEVLELLPEVISWLDRDLFPLASKLRADSRLRVTRADVFDLLASAPVRRHDAILLDVDHSPDELLDPTNESFYRPEGLSRAREHLSEHGVLGVWSSGESAPLVAALGAVFSEVRVETIRWRNELIDQDQEDPIFLARK